MLRISLCLLVTAAFVLVVFAAPQQGYAQGHTDVQSLQYEFGRNVRSAVPALPCPCAKQVVYAPVARPYCYPSCYARCSSPCYYPKYRHVCVRPVYCPPYYRW